MVVPLSAALRRLFNATYLQVIFVQASSAKSLDRAAAEISELLRESHRVRKEDDFQVQNQMDLLKAQTAIADAFTVSIGVIAGLALLVGAVGILGVMLLAVRERRIEMGVRRATGATRRDIGRQFLFEAMLLTVGGGALGMVSGGLAAPIAAYSAGWPVVLSAKLAVLACGLIGATGVVAGVVPARKAARLEPIEALRSK